MEISSKILSIANNEEENFLRRKTAHFDFTKNTKKDVDKLIKNMRAIMYKANGVGLAANQIGLDLSFFVARVENKFYAIFNPKIVKISEEESHIEEGCLSVPGKYGRTSRSEKITLEGQDRNGKPLKIKAWGLLATVFQHEVDHLNGVLFIDKLKK